ncbi:unnamed protein product [Cylindrotheca closterium]|uniref:Uncharacterized protein n=1 Tax=Cylindrotheca closterium TaxID=2856 RepID=A0AAD2GAS0_9STRA|nr:unnamed protein product [Cylindrotheca closterium]
MPSKGSKAWHIWVAASDVDRVAQALFAWLRPETKKCHMPFGARTQFVYDWGAITKGHLGDLAQPGGQWNGIIGKLINTHDTTSQTCTSLAPLFPIQGMLTKVFIPKYCKQGYSAFWCESELELGLAHSFCTGICDPTSSLLMEFILGR